MTVRSFENAQSQLLLLLLYSSEWILKYISLLISKLMTREQKSYSKLIGLHGQRWFSERKGHEKCKAMSGTVRMPHSTCWSRNQCCQQGSHTHTERGLWVTDSSRQVCAALFKDFISVCNASNYLLLI